MFIGRSSVCYVLPLVGLVVGWEQRVTKQIKHNMARNHEIYMNNDKNWPRFFIVESASKDLPLQKLSPFAVQKGFPSNCRNPEEHQETERLDGTFLVECGLRAQARNLLRTERLVD